MDQTQLLKGILEGCVLEMISQKEVYGYELIQLLKEKGYLVSGDVVLLTQGDESEGTTNVCRTLTVE